MATDKSQSWLKQENDAIRELASDLATASLLKHYEEAELLAGVMRLRANLIGGLLDYVEYADYKEQQEE